MWYLSLPILSGMRTELAFEKVAYFLCWVVWGFLEYASANESNLSRLV